MDWPRGSMPGRTQEETEYLACVAVLAMREFSLVGSVTWNKIDAVAYCLAVWATWIL